MSSNIVDIDGALAGYFWVVKETEHLQKTFNNIAGSLVNENYYTKIVRKITLKT